MTWSSPIIYWNGYNVNVSCKWTNTTATTPITIDCGNGTTIAGTWTNFNGVCNYLPWFVGNAQCKVANDISNSACRIPISVNAGQCKSLNALDGSVALVDENHNASSRLRCDTTDGKVAQTITITCGNGTQHTANNVSSLETVCKYTNVDVAQTFPVQCLIDGVTLPMCTTNIIVDQSSLWYCGDGVREWYEKCDDGDLNGTSSSSCSRWCDVKGSSMVGCFNIGNTNISIQKWEMLPFRWTLDNKSNIIHGNTCDGKPDGSIPEDTILCSFNIYNGEHTEANNDPVNSSPIVKKCNADNRWSNVLFQYFLDKQNQWRSLKNAFGKYYIDSSDFVDTTFGEYKISLDKVSYQYCRSDNKNEATEIDRVCSVDFAVTQPYLTQKSSFGLTPKSTTISLDGYKMINWTDLIKSTDLADIMTIDSSEYNGGKNISTMMNNFINKYSKLAVKYGTVTSEEGNTITTYKVPGQDIVVFKGAGTLSYTDTSKTKPFTVIVDGPSINIKGSIENTNSMFLLNKGNITFSPPTNACAKTQIIKGIFITNQWEFLAWPDLTNNDLNKPRCNFGWLKVQWILIWNGIDNLVQTRRSQLNGWFSVWWSSEAVIKSERRNEIFNGASVLIEYSPNLWNALPPGASEFTKALDIYKQ